MSKDDTHQNEMLKYFAKYIEAELGIIYAEHNYFQLQTRLDDVRKTLDVKSLAELHDLAQKGITGKFKTLLLDISTNNETSFFRDGKVFKALEEVFIKLHAEKVSPIKIWSAASSTGQEAISTSIILKELIESTYKNLDYNIIATDISQRVLEIAKEGIYTKLEVSRGLSESLLAKYFTQNPDGRYKVKESILSKIIYKTQNLKEKFLFAHDFDVILCRNVLIYQNIEAKKEIVDRLTEELKPGGYLLLGSGESLIGLSSSYEQLIIEGAVIYKKKGAVL